MNFAGSHTDVETHILRPHTLDEAREIYRNWLSYAANSNDSSLIVFASSEYAEVVRAESVPKGNNKVMLFECGDEAMPDRVVTAKLQRYGASYLAGAMVSEDQAILVLGMEGDESLRLACPR